MDLRAELMPPPLDEARVKRLAELAAWMDGCTETHPHALDWLEAFNREAGTHLRLVDFQGVYGGTGHDTFVRNLLAEPSVRRVPDVTREELLELIRRLTSAGGTEHEEYFWLKL